MSCWLSSTTCPTPASSASRSSRRDFALPWKWILAGSNPARSAMRQLAARGDVARQALLAPAAQHRGAREGLGGEVDLEIVGARGEGRGERPGAGADVVLVDDEARRAELAGELECVAAAQLEVPGLGDPAAERIDVAELGRHGARKATFARSLRKRSGLRHVSHTRLMTPLLALHAATSALPVRWEATLLGGGWRGSADDDLLPAAGLLIDAGFEGAIALEGARVLGWDLRRLVAGESRAGIRLVDDLVARVGKGNRSRPPTAGASAPRSSPPTPSTRSSSSSAWSNGARPAGCAARCATRPSSCSTAARATRRPRGCATRSPTPTAPRTPRSRWRSCCARPTC